MNVSRLCAIATLAWTLSCSSGTSVSPSPSPAPTPTDGGTTVTCQNDPIGIDAYAANMVKSSKSGALKLTLVASDPSPPSVGLNTWVLRVTDGSGTPVAGGLTKVSPFMPYHNHGPSVKPTLVKQPDGSYSVTNIDLFMPGVWQVTVTGAAVDAGSPDVVQLNFCIVG